MEIMAKWPHHRVLQMVAIQVRYVSHFDNENMAHCTFRTERYVLLFHGNIGQFSTSLVQ